MTCIAFAVNLAPIYLTTFADVFRQDGVMLTAEEMGRIMAFIFAGAVTGIVCSGPLADRFGGKRFAMIGLGLIGAGLVGWASAPTYSLLLAAGFIMGLGAGILDMVLSPIVAALQPERKTSAMNWLHSYYCVGAILVTLAGSLAIHFEAPWRLFAAGVAVVPVATLVVFSKLDIPPLVVEGNERVPVGRMLASGFFIVALFAMLLSGAAEAGMAMWLPTFAGKLDFSATAGALALSGFLAAMWLGRVFAALLGHLIPAGLILGLSAFLSAVGYAAAVRLPWDWAALVACILTGFAVGGLWPTMLGLVSHRIPHGGGTMFGLLGTAGNIGCLFAPWVIGFLANTRDLTYAFNWATLVPLGLIGLVVALSLLRAPATGLAKADDVPR